MRHRGLGAVAALACALCVQIAAPHGKLKVGDAPPEKFGRTLSGARVRLADYRGRIVIVSFWASWCPACRKELPLLASIQKQATRDKIVVLSVVWRQEYRDARSIAKILKDRDIDLSLVLDESGYIGNAYDVDAIPHMIIIGRDGKIAAIHVGYSEDEVPQLIDEINALWHSGEPPQAAGGGDPGLHTRLSLGGSVLCTTRSAAHSPHNVPVGAMNCEEKLRLILACDAAQLRLSQLESVRAVGGTSRLEHQRLRRLDYDARRDCEVALAALQAHRRTHRC